MATGIRIRFRRDVEANWVSVNPVLESGELGYVTDKGLFKIGNGADDWASLGYFSPGTVDGSIAPDSDWILRQVSGGSPSGVDSDWVLRQIKDPAAVDSEWVLAQVGDTGSYFYQTLIAALQTDSEQPLANVAAGGPDSEWVLSKIKDPAGVDSDWVLAQVGDPNSYFYQTLIGTLQTDSEQPIAAAAGGPDSNWVLSQITAGVPVTGADSEYVLTQVGSEATTRSNADSDLAARISAIENGEVAVASQVDSDWVSRQIPKIKADSDWIVRTIKRLDVDSDWVQRQINLNRVDSDWVVRTVKRLDLDSDWVLKQSYKYTKEWHVDPVNGRDSDTAYVGSEERPYKTIGRVLAAAGNTGEVIYLHAGTYAESFSVSRLNIDIIGTAVGGIVNITGTATFAQSSSSVRVEGVRFNNLTHTGLGGLYLTDCQVTGTLTKSGAGYFESFNTDTQGTGTSITGAGYANFFGGKQSNVVVNNSAAVVSIKGSTNLTSLQLSSGIVGVYDAIVFAPAGNTTAITALNSTTLVLKNIAAYTSTGLAARITVTGNYSFEMVNIDKTNSTITGTNLGNVSRFDNLAIEGTVPQITTSKKFLTLNTSKQIVEQQLQVDSDWVIRTAKRLDVDSDWILRQIPVIKADSDWVIRTIKRLDIDSDWVSSQITSSINTTVPALVSSSVSTSISTVSAQTFTTDSEPMSYLELKRSYGGGSVIASHHFYFGFYSNINRLGLSVVQGSVVGDSEWVEKYVIAPDFVSQTINNQATWIQTSQPTPEAAKLNLWIDTNNNRFRVYDWKRSTWRFVDSTISVLPNSSNNNTTAGARRIGAIAYFHDVDSLSFVNYSFGSNTKTWVSYGTAFDQYLSIADWENKTTIYWSNLYNPSTGTNDLNGYYKSSEKPVVVWDGPVARYFHDSIINGGNSSQIILQNAESPMSSRGVLRAVPEYTTTTTNRKLISRTLLDLVPGDTHFNRITNAVKVFDNASRSWVYPKASDTSLSGWSEWDSDLVMTSTGSNTIMKPATRTDRMRYRINGEFVDVEIEYMQDSSGNMFPGTFDRVLFSLPPGFTFEASDIQITSNGYVTRGRGSSIFNEGFHTGQSNGTIFDWVVQPYGPDRTKFAIAERGISSSNLETISFTNTSKWFASSQFSMRFIFTFRPA